MPAYVLRIYSGTNTTYVDIQARDQLLTMFAYLDQQELVLENATLTTGEVDRDEETLFYAIVRVTPAGSVLPSSPSLAYRNSGNTDARLTPTHSISTSLGSRIFGDTGTPSSSESSLVSRMSRMSSGATRMSEPSISSHQDALTHILMRQQRRKRRGIEKSKRQKICSPILYTVLSVPY